MRPAWDEYFAGICRAVAARGDCRRAQVGALIVLDNRIVSTGYNGSEPGGPSCLAGECPRAFSDDPQLKPDYSNCVALHAEQNAIAYANARDTRGATLYCTRPPCDMCGKLVKAAGIVRVVVVDP